MLRSRNAPIFAAFALIVPLWAAAWAFTIDDAYILVRYAQRLASGQGYTFNDGVPSDGVTGPLWLAPLALAARLGVDVLAASKGLSAVCAGLALTLVVHRARAGMLGRVRAWWVLLLSATALPFVIWSVAGLETGGATLAITVGALAATARPRPRPWLAGLAFACVPWLRPELLPCALVFVTLLAVRNLRAAFATAGMCLAGAASVLAFRLVTFGRALPLSASAKPAILTHGVEYLLRAALSPRGLLLVLAFALAASLRARAPRALALALAVHATAIVLAGGDWMPGRRLFAPLVPLFALLVGGAWARYALRHPRTIAAFAACVSIANVHELMPELTRARNAGQRQRARVPALAAIVCGQSGPIAAIDVGALGVACPRDSFLDLGGLVDPPIGDAPGGHLDKRLSEQQFTARAPALILLHSRERPRIDERGQVRWFAGYPIERRVLSFRSVQSAYVAEQVFEYAEDYFYVTLVRSR